jgi:hypothetical protein
MPAGAIKSPHALHATRSSARAGGSDQRANSLSLGEHSQHQAPDPHHTPPAAAAAALPVQGGACDFGSDASERSEKGGVGGWGGVENSDAEGGGYSDGNTAAEAASVVGPPSAVECLLSVLESHGGALAKGSALLGYLESCRTVQVFFFFCVLILLQGLCVTRVPRELSHSPGVFSFFFSVSSYCYTGSALLGYLESCRTVQVFFFPSFFPLCPQTAAGYLLILLLCMCSYCCYIHPHAIYVSSYCSYVCPRTAAMYVLILLLYTSSCYICVLILLLCISSYCCYACAHTGAIRAHCCYTCALPLSLAVVACICVLMLLHMCPHTAPMYVPVLLLCMCSRCCYTCASPLYFAGVSGGAGGAWQCGNCLSVFGFLGRGAAIYIYRQAVIGNCVR